MAAAWFLDGTQLYASLCPHKFREYKRTHDFLRYRKGDYVYFENDCSNKLFLIEKGKVKLGYCDEEGDEVVTIILSKGDVFGEKAFLGEEKRSEFAQIQENDTAICPIPVHTLEGLLRDNARLSVGFYKFLGFRFRKIERRIQILLFKDVKTRLIEYFKELKEDYGVEMLSGEVLVRHPYTQKEIATLIGTSRPTLNLLMNELKEAGFIDYNQKELLLKKAFLSAC